MLLCYAGMTTGTCWMILKGLLSPAPPPEALMPTRACVDRSTLRIGLRSTVNKQ